MGERCIPASARHLYGGGFHVLLFKLRGIKKTCNGHACVVYGIDPDINVINLKTAVDRSIEHARK
jgi:hypothetical protein